MQHGLHKRKLILQIIISLIFKILPPEQNGEPTKTTWNVIRLYFSFNFKKNIELLGGFTVGVMKIRDRALFQT